MPEPLNAGDGAFLWLLLVLELRYSQTPTQDVWQVNDRITGDDIPSELNRLLRKWERVRVILTHLGGDETTDIARKRSTYANCRGVRLLSCGRVIGEFLRPGVSVDLSSVIDPPAPKTLRVQTPRRAPSAPSIITPPPLEILQPVAPPNRAIRRARKRAS